MVQSWNEMMQAAQSMNEQDKVKRVNEFFNRKIQFGEDQAVWGENDYWATPLEFMGKGVGDCEDFAITKYFALRSLNVPNDRLRITYVKARIGGPRSDVTQAHMVLGYYEDPTGEPLILDNLITELRPASRRTDLMPVFSFNSEGLWTGSGAAEKKDTGGSTAKLSRWRDLIARMQSDGFE
jgi:predicted transglutaminase-like cysteine proteinase